MAAGTPTGTPTPTKPKAATARTILTQLKLIEEDKTDLASLTSALVKIAGQLGKSKTTKNLGDAVKAVAALMEDAAVNTLADRMADSVANKLSVFTSRPRISLIRLPYTV
jgi:hypothetical protein